MKMVSSTISTTGFQPMSTISWKCVLMPSAAMAVIRQPRDAVLPASVWNCEQESPTRLPESGVDLRAHLTLIERSLISQALQRSGGTVAHAARLLSLRRTTLVEKLRKLGMAGA